MTVDPDEAAVPTAWTPAIGQVLKHRAISQSIEITGAMKLDGLPTFWQVHLQRVRRPEAVDDRRDGPSGSVHLGEISRGPAPSRWQPGRLVRRDG